MEPTVTELLAEGVMLMLVGMTIVYGFLLLLVGILFAMSRVASCLAPDTSVAAALTSAGESGHAGAADPRIAAVIAAAVSYHRRQG